MAKHVVFDVVGTCVGFEAFFAGIDHIIGPVSSPTT
jgi:2-haloacid dehalogenase